MVKNTLINKAILKNQRVRNAEETLFLKLRVIVRLVSVHRTTIES